MDTIKIGSFLRELRKEEKLTQEQLAEVFNVSARTVSRWETGNNMPDISILIEIADYYHLDVREILNGERSNTVSEDTSALKDVAEYADKEKEKMALRTRIYSILGIIGILTYVFVQTLGNNLVIKIIASISLILVYAALVSSLIYTSSRLQTLQRKVKAKLKKNIVIVIITLVLGVIALFTLVPFLLIGAN